MALRICDTVDSQRLCQHPDQQGYAGAPGSSTSSAADRAAACPTAPHWPEEFSLHPVWTRTLHTLHLNTALSWKDLFQDLLSEGTEETCVENSGNGRAAVPLSPAKPPCTCLRPYSSIAANKQGNQAATRPLKPRELSNTPLAARAAALSLGSSTAEESRPALQLGTAPLVSSTVSYYREAASHTVQDHLLLFQRLTRF